MIQEFRRARRRMAPETIVVDDAMTDQVIGRIGNLSETGMLLLASDRLADDALYQLRFSLPGPDGDQTLLELGAHLLWTDRANAPGQSWAGFRFIGLGDEQARRLRSWVEAPGSHYI